MARHAVVVGTVLVAEAGYLVLFLAISASDVRRAYMWGYLLAASVTVALYPVVRWLGRRITSATDLCVTLLVLACAVCVALYAGLLVIAGDDRLSVPAHESWKDILLLPVNVMLWVAFAGIFTSWVWLPIGLLAFYLLNRTRGTEE